MNAVPDIKSLAQKISGLTKNGLDDASTTGKNRRELQIAMRELGFALESTSETMQRLAYLPLQNAVVRIGIEVGLFETVVEAGPSGKTIKELVASTGVEEALLTRLLRPLTAIGLLVQMDANRYAATRLSETCIKSPMQAGLRFLFDFIGPVFQTLPAYLAETQYRCPTEKCGPLQATYHTELSGFEYVMQPQNASVLKDFNLFMKGRREASGISSWLDFYPFRDRIISGSEESSQAVLMVDVGGGLGHGLQELRAKFPDLSGRLILQDLPKTIEQAEHIEGVFEPMAHDFLTPQPIQSARAYYIRQVLHDWPDDSCRIILKHTAAVLRRGYSKILINECIVPDEGVNEFVSTIDVVMMALGGGKERTESQWRDLLAAVGLRIEMIWTLDDVTESVMEVVLA